MSDPQDDHVCKRCYGNVLSSNTCKYDDCPQKMSWKIRYLQARLEIMFINLQKSGSKYPSEINDWFYENGKAK